MDLRASLPAFVAAALLIAASPGPAMALVLRRAALRGLRGVMPTVLGLEAGLYLWALAAAAGFAGLVAASETAYVTLRAVGALVLCPGCAGLVRCVYAWTTLRRDRGASAEQTQLAMRELVATLRDQARKEQS